MARFDLFTTVHKGLRAALFAAAQDAGRADFSERGEAEAIAAAVRRLVRFLAEHAALEEAFIAPELKRLCPELAATLQGDHSRLAGLERELLARVERMVQARDAERLAHGRRLGLQLTHLVAEQLLHMEREEVVAQRHLSAHRSDTELAELHRRILAAVPAERQAAWLELLEPAVDPAERAQLAGERAPMETTT